MSMSDPIADLLTRMRNALAVRKKTVRVPHSKVKMGILETMKREGFVREFEVVAEELSKDILIHLKYSEDGRTVISSARRISKPGCRVYRGNKDLRPVLSGMGILVVSTPLGVMSDRECREKSVGGEVLCEIW